MQVKATAFWGSAIGLGLVLGCASTLLLLGRGGLSGGVSSGPWQTNLSSGNVDADLYTRAVVARRGLLALSREETLYYTATTDSDGRPLRGDCAYRLHGTPLAARWWSITAYGADSYLIPNPQRQYSLSQTTVSREPGGSYTIDVGADPRGRNPLPVKDGEPFELTARLYNPDRPVYEAPQDVALPRIERVTCR